jgi:hypothetical protein
MIEIHVNEFISTDDFGPGYFNGAEVEKEAEDFSAFLKNRLKKEVGKLQKELNIEITAKIKISVDRIPSGPFLQVTGGGNGNEETINRIYDRMLRILDNRRWELFLELTRDEK